MKSHHIQSMPLLSDTISLHPPRCSSLYVRNDTNYWHKSIPIHDQTLQNITDVTPTAANTSPTTTNTTTPQSKQTNQLGDRIQPETNRHTIQNTRHQELSIGSVSLVLRSTHHALECKH